MYKLLLWTTLVASALCQASSSPSGKPCADSNPGMNKVNTQSKIINLSDESQNVNVTVGANGDFAFVPDNVSNRPVGSFVTFMFYPKAHSVTESIFAKPCVPVANLTAEEQATLGSRQPINTGLVPVSPNDTTTTIFTYQIQDEKPVWLFCIPHCSLKGMVMVINQSQNATVAAVKNVDNYRTAAEALQSSSTNSSSSTATTASASGAGPTPAPSVSVAAAGTSSGAAPTVSVFSGNSGSTQRPASIAALAVLGLVIGVAFL